MSAIASQYSQIADLIQNYKPVWNQSVLKAWPDARNGMPHEWVDSFRYADLRSLGQLDQFLSSLGSGLALDIPKGLPASLEKYVKLIQTALPEFTFQPAVPLPTRMHRRLTAKKRHEVAAVVAFVDQQRASGRVSQLIDVGGGAGHLIRCASELLMLPALSIDRDEALQKLGQSLLESGKGQDFPKVRFTLQDVCFQSQPEIDSAFASGCFSIGLHTCGPLALAHLSKSQACAGVLNVGCCYDRLDPEREARMSTFVQSQNLQMSSYALFLATRGRWRSSEELAMQEKVNSYRMAMHLYLQEVCGIDGFMSVGDAPKALYKQGVVQYIQNRVRALGLEPRLSEPEIASFVESPLVSSTMREFFISNILRNMFSRPLELLILLDRCLWLMEQGYQVDMVRLFDYRVSPRNLGIYASFA